MIADDDPLQLDVPDTSVSNPGFPVALTRIDPAAVELALQDAAIGGVSWREVLTERGIQRLYSSRAPNAAACEALLGAHVPERYGQAAGVALPPVLIITDPVQLRAMLADSRRNVPSNVIEHEK